MLGPLSRAKFFLLKFKKLDFTATLKLFVFLFHKGLLQKHQYGIYE